MNSSPAPNAPDEGGGDPWAAFGYLVAGVLFYGVIGWLLSTWLHADYWIPIGIVVGAGFGMYLVFARYLVKPSHAEHRTSSTSSPDSTPSDDEGAKEIRPDRDDRGETA